MEPIDNVLARLEDISERLRRLEAIEERLARIESSLGMAPSKDTYTTEEIAERLGRSEWTVRQWLNLGQANEKKVHGRGRQGEWRVNHDERSVCQKNNVEVVETRYSLTTGLASLFS